MRKIILLFLLLLFSQYSRADLFGGDVGVLIQLASTAVKQLNEMERLVSNTEKYTQKVQEYNEILQDRVLFANQVLYKLEGLKSLPKGNVKDLGGINSMIRELKWRISDFHQVLAHAEIDLKTAESVKESSMSIDHKMQLYQKLADQQKRLSNSANKNISINKSNAITNAYALEVSGLSLQVQNQNLYQNATQTEYIIKDYEQKKMKEKDFSDFWFGSKEVYLGTY